MPFIVSASTTKVSNSNHHYLNSSPKSAISRQTNTTTTTTLNHSISKQTLNRHNQYTNDTIVSSIKRRSVASISIKSTVTNQVVISCSTCQYFCFILTRFFIAKEPNTNMEITWSL